MQSILPSSRRIRIIANSAVFLMVFAAVLAFADRFRRPQTEWENTLAYLALHPDRHQVIFIGSSRIVHGLDPRVFDRVLREHGLDLGPSLIVGSAGSHMYHSDYMFDRVLETGARPRFVFIEADQFRGIVNYGRLSRTSYHNVSWHDLERTWGSFRSLAKEPRVGFIEKISIALGHLETMYGHYHPATGQAFGDVFEPVIDDSRIRYVERTGGYLAYSSQTLNARDWLDVLREPSLWEERVRRFANSDASDKVLPPVDIDAFRSQIARAQRHDIQLIYLAPPGVQVTSPPYNYMIEQEMLAPESASNPDPRQSLIPVFMNFNQPSRYPELFVLEHRYDWTHLNHQGIEIFSELVALRFLENFYPDLVVRGGGPEASE